MNERAEPGTPPAAGNPFAEGGGSLPLPAALALRAEADASLATALIEGRREAARQAWRQLEPLARRTLCRYPSLSFCHEDLCQEAFLRFFSRITELRNPRALRRFLVGICMGVAQNELRRTLLRRIEIPLDDGESTIPGVDTSFEAREAISKLCEVLACCDAEDRALFLSRHVEKQEVQDLAVRGGWSIGATKRRLARATRRVGSRLVSEPALAGYAMSFSPAA